MTTSRHDNVITFFEEECVWGFETQRRLASSIEPTATGIEETLRKRRRTRATKCSLSFSLHVERILIVASTQEGTSSFFFFFGTFFGEKERKKRRWWKIMYGCL